MKNLDETPKQEMLTYTESAKKDERIFNATMMKQETLEKAGAIAAGLCEHLEAKEQAMFIAGFQECAKWEAENTAEWQQHNIKDPNACEHYKEVGCIKDICDCYILIKVKPNKAKYEGNSI